jgi:hypothetical protein
MCRPSSPICAAGAAGKQHPRDERVVLASLNGPADSGGRRAPDRCLRRLEVDGVSCREWEADARVATARREIVDVAKQERACVIDDDRPSLVHARARRCAQVHIEIPQRPADRHDLFHQSLRRRAGPDTDEPAAARTVVPGAQRATGATGQEALTRRASRPRRPSWPRWPRRPVGADNSISAVSRWGPEDRRLIGRVSGGGGSFSGRGPVVLVLVASATARPGRASASLGARERDRDPAAAASTAGTGAPSRSSAADTGRSGAVGGVLPCPASASVADVGFRDAGDAFALASRAGRASLDVSASASRTPADTCEGTCAGGAAGAGEPGLGLSADSG